MTPSDNTLVEVVAAAIASHTMRGSRAEHVLQAICSYSGLTVEILEMIREGEAVVVKTETGFVLGKQILNTPIERQKT